MKKNKIWIIVVTLVTVLCVCMIAGGFAIYKVFSNPTIEAGLDQLGDDLQEMTKLRNRILRDYDVEDVSVQLVNGNTLVITLVNYNDHGYKSVSDYRVIAFELARNSIFKYKNADKITGVTINFTQKKNFLIFSTSQSRTYPFSKKEITK